MHSKYVRSTNDDEVQPSELRLCQQLNAFRCSLSRINRIKCFGKPSVGFFPLHMIFTSSSISYVLGVLCVRFAIVPFTGICTRADHPAIICKCIFKAKATIYLE